MSNLSSVRVLVVDDLDSNIVALQAVLEALPVQVVTARSGEEALRAMLSEDFAVVLLDVHMPILDGYETARLMRARERSRNVPIMFVTAAHDGPEFVSRAYTVGAVDYMVKPLDPDILRAKIGFFVELELKSNLVLKQAEQLRQVSELKMRSVLARLSHDLRTPLNAIVGWTQIMKAGELDGGKRHQAVETIDRNARKLARLVAELDVSAVGTWHLSARDALDCRTLEPTVSIRMGELQPGFSDNGGTRPIAHAPEQTCLHSTRLGGVHVLLVEDDPDSSELVEVVLRLCGADVTSVPTVAAAFRALAARRPDVLISDIGLPDEDGLTLIRRIRKTEGLAGLPAIAISAYASRCDVHEVLAAGFQAHVAKPIEPSQLGMIIASVISG